MLKTAPGSDEKKDINGLVMNFVASGFWTNTMLGVRRLADHGNIRDRKGVCSISGLINDIRDHRHLISRRVFVEEIAGQPYDYEEVDRRYWEHMRSIGPGMHAIPNDLDSDLSKHRHTTFDWLSGKKPDERTPDDLIRDEVFAQLRERLARMKDIVEHVHVVHAHAATEFSSKGRVLDSWSLSDARETLRNLVELAELTGNWFCFESLSSVIPSPMFDQFEHLDKPLFAGDTATLQEVWYRHAEEIGEWHNIDHEAL